MGERELSSPQREPSCGQYGAGRRDEAKVISENPFAKTFASGSLGSGSRVWLRSLVKDSLYIDFRCTAVRVSGARWKT